MIELKNRDVVQESLYLIFAQRVSGLRLPAQVSYRFLKLGRALEKARKSFSQQYEALGAGFAKKDEHGKSIVKDLRTGEFEIEESKTTEYETALNALLDTVIQIQEHKIPFSGLAGAAFSPSEMAFLEPFLEGLEEGESLIPPQLQAVR